MKKALVLLVALFLTATPSRANPYDLPQDCAIIASEAYVRISPVAYWCRMLFIQVQTIFPPGLAGHVMVTWQMSPHGPVFVYDANGTLCLEKINERDALKIACVLVENRRPPPLLLSAHFVKP